MSLTVSPYMKTVYENRGISEYKNTLTYIGLLKIGVRIALKYIHPVLVCVSGLCCSRSWNLQETSFRDVESPV